MSSSPIRRIAAALGLTVLVGAFVAFAAPAQAQYLDAIACDAIAADGSTVTISGDGFEPGTDVTVSITQDGVTEVLGTATVDATSAFVGTFDYPADFDPTSESVYTAEGFAADGENDVVSTEPLVKETTLPDPCVIEVEVLPDTATPTPTPEVEGELAFTGSSTMPMITIAVGAIALGSLVLFGIRTRRQDA